MAAPRPGPPRRRSAAAARRRRRQRRAARVTLVALLAVLVGATTFVGGLLAAPFDERAVPPPSTSVLLLAADGTQFAQIPPPVRRDLVTAEEIPDVMRDAIISAEDERFLDHSGVDPVATVRAAYRDLTGGRLQGGSTITQQYVKNVYVDNDRTLVRKLREAAISVRLESRKSKQDILTDYLNVLYLGNGVYGVQAAAKYYYGVDVRDLDLDETTGQRVPALALARASLIAGMVPAPSAWNPVRDMAAAKVRQRYALNRMVIGGLITPQQAAEAFTVEIVPVQETPPVPPTSAPEYADLVKAQLKSQFSGESEDLLYRGGLRVKTALDLQLQEAVTRAAREVLPDSDDPQAAVVAFDWRSGDVRAMTTLRRVPAKGDSPAQDGYVRDGYNLATNAYRSTGSTLKPFTLAVALQQGQSLNTRRFAPSRDSIPNPGGKPDPYVYSNAAGEGGPSRTVTLRQALQKSINTVFVPLAIEVGRANVADLLKAAGAKDNPADPIAPGNLSFGLGAGVEVTPLSMANAFGTLMNGGQRVDPRFVVDIRDAEDRPRDTVDRTPTATPVLPKEVADQVVEAMSGVTSGAGTAPQARQDFVVHGKTGTTNDSVDAWFIGCSKEPHFLCIATWMGYEFPSCTGVQGRSCGGMLNVNGVEQVFGGTLPARVFDRTFEVYEEVKAAAAAPPPVPGAAPAEAAPTESPSATPRRSRTTTRTTAPAPATAPEPAPQPEQSSPPPEPEPEPEPTRSSRPPDPPPPSDPPILPPTPG